MFGLFDMGGEGKVSIAVVGNCIRAFGLDPTNAEVNKALGNPSKEDLGSKFVTFVDWHVFFEGNKLGSQVFFGWVSKGLVNFGVGWVKAESTDAVSDNGDGNFAFTAHVEKAEHFFEVSKLIFSVVTHFVVIDLSDLTSE